MSDIRSLPRTRSSEPIRPRSFGVSSEYGGRQKQRVKIQRLRLQTARWQYYTSFFSTLAILVFSRDYFFSPSRLNPEDRCLSRKTPADRATPRSLLRLGAFRSGPNYSETTCTAFGGHPLLTMAEPERRIPRLRPQV